LNSPDFTVNVAKIQLLRLKVGRFAVFFVHSFSPFGVQRVHAHKCNTSFTDLPAKREIDAIQVPKMALGVKNQFLLVDARFLSCHAICRK
jgi:hypothetical protein